MSHSIEDNDDHIARRLLISFIALCSLFMLTGCYYYATEAEALACEDRGGEVLTTKAYYSSSSFGGDRKTGIIEYCDSDGTPVEVYNDEITKLKGGVFGTNEKNSKIFKLCREKHGRTYETSVSGDSGTDYYFVCYRDGQFLKILD